MASVMELVVRARDEASNVFENVKESGGGAASFLEDNWGKIAVAGGVAGTAAEGFARKQAGTNAILNRAAIVTGENRGELRDSIDAMTDHTFASEDAAKGMEELMRRGIDSKKGFEDVLPVIDTFADATGKDMVGSIQTVDQVLKSLGIPIEEAGDNIDYFTQMATQTDIPMGTLERNLSRVGPELQGLEFGMGDASAGIEVFRDRGLDGREAVREFRRAVEDADGDMGVFLDTMEISEDEWKEYQEGAEGAVGLTDEFAEANNSTMTPMEKVQQNVENLMTKYGGLAEAAGIAGPALLGLGPILKGVTMAKQGAAAAARGLGVAMKFALGPVGLIIAAVAALVAGVIWAWNNVDWFRDGVMAAWEAIQRAVEVVVEWFTETLVPTLQEVWARVVEGVQQAVEWVKSAWAGIKEFFTNLWEGIKAVMEPVITWFQEHVGPVFTSIAELFTEVWSQITEPFQEAWNKIRSIWEGSGQGIIETIKNAWTVFKVALKVVWDAVTAAFRQTWDKVKSVWDAVGPPIIAVMKGAWEQAKNTIETIWNVIKTVIETVLGVIKGIIDTVTAAIKGDWEGVWQGIKDIFSSIWEGLKEILRVAFEWLKETVQIAVDTVKDVWNAAWDAIKEKVSGIWETIKEKVQEGIDNVREFVTDGVDRVKEGWNDTWDAIKDKVRTALEAAKNAAKTPINGLIGLVNSVIGAINGIPSVSIPDWVPGVGGNSFSIPHIPKIPTLAKGGMFVAGERGPESVRVAPLTRDPLIAEIRDLKEALRSGNVGGQSRGVGDVRIQQDIHGLTPQEVTRQTKRALREEAGGWWRG